MSNIILKQTNRRGLIFAGSVALLLYAVLPHIGGLRHSWTVLSHPSWGWVAVAISLTLLTYLAAALTYYFLALRPIIYWQMVLIQLAAMFVNKLLPAGIGALGANYSYFRYRRYSKIAAGSVVAVNNIIGICGHLLVLALSLAFFHSHLNLVYAIHKPGGFKLILTGAIILLAAVSLFVVNSQHARTSLVKIKIQFTQYLGRPFSLLAALGSSISLTLFNVLALFCCGLALGVNLHFVEMLMVFTAGAVVATAVPTPGGLGGFEAGLFAGLVGFQVPVNMALAVVLLYRLASYWLPLLIGAVAFAIAQAKGYFAL